MDKVNPTELVAVLWELKIEESFASGKPHRNWLNGQIRRTRNAIAKLGIKVCPTCHGHGDISRWGVVLSVTRCNWCEGTGYSEGQGKSCYKCEGTGYFVMHGFAHDHCDTCDGKRYV